MTKLLYAGIHRYCKNRVFRLILLLNALLAAHHGFESGRDYFKETWALLGVLELAVIIAMTMGEEYESGAFRNKTVIGHSRSTLFFSELLLAMGAGLVLLAEYTVIFLGFHLYVFRDLPASFSLQVFLSFLGITLAMSAVFVFLGTLARNRAAMLILCVLVMLVMIFSGNWLWDNLAHSETNLVRDTEIVTMTDPFGNEYTDIRFIPGTEREEPNPLYVAPPLRTVYEAAYYLMPCGVIPVFSNILNYNSALNYSAHDPSNTDFDFSDFQLQDKYQRVLDLSPRGSLAVVVLAALGGWLIFRKKDFK